MTITIGAVALILLVAMADAAFASRPVARVTSGCVQGGVFVSDTGYDYRVLNMDRSTADLSPFEGRRLIIDGDLLPGDRFILRRDPEVRGPCH